jgi:hypothetical protein
VAAAVSDRGGRDRRDRRPHLPPEHRADGSARARVAEYAIGQSFLLGVRGTVAPFVAAFLLATLAPRAVLAVGIAFMAVGTVLFSSATAAYERGVAREGLAGAS